MNRYEFSSLKVSPNRSNAGSAQTEAAVVADNLVSANLRGIDYTERVLPVYVQRLSKGVIATPARMRVVRSMRAAALLDGGNGWGAVVGTRGMQMAMDMAGTTGVGAVTVINSNHFGYAAYYGEMASGAT